MDDMRFAEYEYYMKNRPHVVILGAGASCAAIPNGDKNGKRISAMSGFIDKLGLTNIISKVKINTASDSVAGTVACVVVTVVTAGKVKPKN